MAFDYHKNNGGVIAQQLCKRILLNSLDDEVKLEQILPQHIGPVIRTLFEGPYSMTSQ